MRAVQIIQAASAAAAAIVITFLQPIREQISNPIIGTIGLLIISTGFAASYLVSALRQKTRGAYVANGILIFLSLTFIYLGASDIPKMAERFNMDVPKGADDTFALMDFVILSVVFFFGTGFVMLLKALKHRPPSRLFWDSLITAIIFFGAAACPFLFPGGGVSAVGFVNAACILAAVHLGITAFSPKQTA